MNSTRPAFGSVRLLVMFLGMMTLAFANDSVNWECAATPGKDPREFTLTVTARIGTGWHVYGRTGGGSGQDAILLQLKHVPGIEPVGDWIWPKPEIVHEGRPIEIYTGTQTFTRKLKVTTATGEAKLRVTISYQACTHELCGPPEEEELTTTLKILGAK